jgi:hypothetical protein
MAVVPAAQQGLARLRARSRFFAHGSGDFGPPRNGRFATVRCSLSRRRGS